MIPCGKGWFEGECSVVKYSVGDRMHHVVLALGGSKVVS